MNALIVADGDVPTRETLLALLPPGRLDLIVAADGGALKAAAAGFTPHVVVGDADSLAPEAARQLQGQGAEVVVHPAAKDESDTELAVHEALRRGADRMLIVGAFGGRRIEHTIANLLLLCLPALSGRDVRLADGSSQVRLLEPGRPLDIDGVPGDFVSLLPLDPGVRGVTTSGLEFPLADEPLEQGPARGLSNLLSGTHATVSVREGRLLVVHTRADA